jgi:hypothetical protein
MKFWSHCFSIGEVYQICIWAHCTSNQQTVDREECMGKTRRTLSLFSIFVTFQFIFFQTASPAIGQSVSKQGRANKSESSRRQSGLIHEGVSLFGMPATVLIGKSRDYSIKVDDFNGDGKIDIVVSRSGSNAAWIVPGLGPNSFETVSRLNLSEKQRTVALGDFNDDGIDDNALSDQFSSDVKMLYGSKKESSVSIGENSSCVLVADFNEDGIADIAIADSRSDHIEIRLGKKNGGFKSSTSIPAILNPDYITSGDFDGDDVTDIVVVKALSNSVSIFTGDGKGGFVNTANLEIGLRPDAIAVGDLNGDLLADLAAVNTETGKVSVLYGDGKGRFSLPFDIGQIDFGREDESARQTGSGLVTAAASVLSLSLDASTVAGGSGRVLTATLTLSEPAPPGGTVVAVTSSNTELAAAPVTVTVPGGETRVTFDVATNPEYRRFSRLAFAATITASTGTVSRSATFTVTAPTIPGTISSDSSQREGLMCGGNFPVRQGVKGILYNCRKADVFTANGTCNFQQECPLGCQTRQPNGFSFRDACATTPPFPIALAQRAVVGGASTTGTLFLSAPAPRGSEALVTSSNPVLALVEPTGFFPIPTGATTAGFMITTMAVPSPAFIAIGGDIATPQGNFISHRLAQTFLTLLPSGEPIPPPPPLAVSNLVVNIDPVTGGNNSTATITLNRLVQGGSFAVNLSSSDPSIVSVPASVPIALGSNNAMVSITTRSVTQPVTVTITASAGGATVTDTLSVNPGAAPPPPPPPPPAATLTTLAVNPTSLVGGNSASGTLTLSGAAPSSGAVIALTSSNPSIVSVPATVTIGAGGSSATFSISTQSVTASTSVTLSATYGGTTRTSTITLTPQAQQPADTVSIQRAEYDSGKRELRVEARSTNSSAVLQCYVTSTNTLVGTLTNNGGGNYSGRLNVSSNPQNITIRSSLGGAASRAVTAK